MGKGAQRWKYSQQPTSFYLMRQNLLGRRRAYCNSAFKRSSRDVRSRTRPASGNGLKPGMKAEIAIAVAWSRLLDDRIPLQPVPQVTITGSQENVTEERIRAYHFRTAA